MDDLAKKLNDLLLEKDLRLATAESCTGGMVSSNIISCAGASKIFDRGFITYTNSSKQEILNVSENIINYYGAVSEQCANAMAIGALDNSQANIAVAITGIAGPEGGSEEKPVGLVYIAVEFKWDKSEIKKFNFTGSRNEIREQACKAALSMLINVISTAV